MQRSSVHPGVTDTSLCLSCPGHESRAGRGELGNSLGISLAGASSLEDGADDGRRDLLGKNQFKKLIGSPLVPLCFLARDSQWGNP